VGSSELDEKRRLSDTAPAIDDEQSCAWGGVLCGERRELAPPVDEHRGVQGVHVRLD
jgi:hypothetical protein